MNVITKINDLIDAHENYVDCPGCPKCDEIKRLRKFIGDNPEQKFKHILEKRDDMTISDIKYLLDKDVTRKQIRKYMDMTNKEFTRMMIDLGFTKKYQIKESDIAMKKTSFDIDKYHELKKQGLKKSEIAKELGITYKALWGYEKRNGLIKNSDKQKEYEAVKQEVKEAAAESPEVVQELKKKIAELEEQVSKSNTLADENKKLHEELKNMHDAASDTENEVQELNKDKQDLMVEVEEWKEKASLYARDNDLTNEVNKQLREIVEQRTEMVGVLRTALKAVL